MAIDLHAIKKLREATGAGIADCRQALEETSDMDKAREWILKKGIARAEKKGEREVKAGAVFSYIHHTGRVGTILSLACETDFVAKTDDFVKLGKELAAQVAAVKPEDVKALLESEYFRQPSKITELLIKETIGKLGENIVVVDFAVLVI
jgi:elongation factor Ts